MQSDRRYFANSSYKSDDDQGIGIGWSIFIFLLIIVIILAIAIVVARPWVSDNIPLNQPCDANNICIAGTSCENGTCKSNPGQYCDNLGDCTSVSVECRDNTCFTAEMKSYI